MKCLTPLILLLALPAMAQQSVLSGHLRRRVVQPNGQSLEVPVQGMAVTVWCTSAKIGRSNLTYADPNGYWVLKGIPVGTYVLEVWVRPKHPWTYPITVNANSHYFGVLYVP